MELMVFSKFDDSKKPNKGHFLPQKVSHLKINTAEAVQPLTKLQNESVDAFLHIG